MEAQTELANSIWYNIAKIAQFYPLCKKADELIFVVGHSKAGKSILIDLLANKTIEEVQDETGVKQLRQAQNFKCLYDPIYFQLFEQGKKKTLFLEGFTLDTNLESSPVNHLKGIYLKIALTIVKKISIIVTIEESYKQDLTPYIEHLLDCWGLLSSQNEHYVKYLSTNTYLLITKTEEDRNEVEQLKEEKDDIIEQGKTQGTKEILHYLLNEEKILQFPIISQNLTQKRQEFLQFFKPLPLDSQLKDFFLKYSDVDLERQSQKQILSIFSSFAQVFDNFWKYVNDDPKAQKEYIKSIQHFFKKKTFYQNLMPRKIQTRFINKQIISKIKPYSNLKFSKNKQTLKKVLEGFNVITTELLEAEERQGYQQLQGVTTFFLYLFKWIKEDNWDSEILTHLNNSIKMINEKIIKIQSIHKPDLKDSVGKSQAMKSSLDKKPGSKRKTPFTQFRNQIEKFSNNGEVLEYCFNSIRQKEMNKNYQWSDVIYHIRIIRDLLILFEENKTTAKTIFAQEMLILYLYNDNYYDFQRLLSKYTIEKSLSLEFSKDLIQDLDQRQCYESEIKVIQYVRASSFSYEDFNVMDQLRNRAIRKREEKYNAYSQTAKTTKTARDFNLKVTLKDLIEKAETSIKKQYFSDFLKKDQFRTFIE